MKSRCPESAAGIVFKVPITARFRGLVLQTFNIIFKRETVFVKLREIHNLNYRCPESAAVIVYLISITARFRALVLQTFNNFFHERNCINNFIGQLKRIA